MRRDLTDRQRAINDFFADLNAEPLYYVGGCVRDLVMGQTPHDYDLASANTPETIEEYIRSKNRRPYRPQNNGKRFGTIGVKVDGDVVEITTFRGETYSDGTRKPTVVWGRHLEQDLMRRDFTINAMAQRADTGEIVDPFGGVHDVELKLVRSVGFPSHRFREDPLRILRAIRFAGRFEFAIEPKTREKIESFKWELARISRERIVQEFEKMFALPADALRECVTTIFDTGIFEFVCAPMALQYKLDQKNPHHRHPLHQHTIETVASVAEMLDAVPETPRGGALRHEYLWAALLHDIGKPFTKREKTANQVIPGHCNYINHHVVGAEVADAWMAQYKFSNSARSWIADSILHHLEDGHWLRRHDNRAKGIVFDGEGLCPDCGANMLQVAIEEYACPRCTLTADEQLRARQMLRERKADAQ